MGSWRLVMIPADSGRLPASYYNVQYRIFTKLFKYAVLQLWFGSSTLILNGYQNITLKYVTDIPINFAIW
jgi:hypothetical protein